MTQELWIAIVVFAVFVIYVAGKVLNAMRKSEQEWKQVDKSKLKVWDDDAD